jgi:hypothetical protein
MCYVEAKHISNVPVSNIIYGSNPKVTVAKYKKPASQYVHTNAKSVIVGTCSIVRNFLNYK